MINFRQLIPKDQILNSGSEQVSPGSLYSSQQPCPQHLLTGQAPQDEASGEWGPGEDTVCFGRPPPL